MDQIVLLISDFVNLFWDPIGRQINYSRELRANFQKLKDKARDLSDRKKDIKEELEDSDGKKVTTNECKTWFQKVEETEQEINQIEGQYQQGQKCFVGWCPDILSRMSLGKRVIRALNSVNDHLEKSNHRENLLRDAPPTRDSPSTRDAPPTRESPPTRDETVQLPNIVEKRSLERNLRKVMGYMRDERVHRLGIWGMGGVGKTTLMTALENSSEISRDFGLVILVRVSKDGSVGSVKKKFAEHLALDLSNEESEERLASKIHQYLLSKKFLLLLDDVWESIDLVGVGIPNPKEQKKGSKILLATRYQTVCNEMETEENVKVDFLSAEEAWELFSEKVGNVPNLENMYGAKDVVKERDGLPLAIQVLGEYLKNNTDFHVWKDALKELKSPTSSSIGKMEDRVFKPLKFSYDRLKDDNIKECFLYCALFPEGYRIREDELVEYWRAEGLIGDTENIEVAYDKGCAILNTLVQSSLLEMREAHLYVMQNMLRDLALKIALPNGKFSERAGTGDTSPTMKGGSFLVRAGMGDRSPPEEEKWKDRKRISLMSNGFDSLHVRPDCPMLSTLLLQRNKLGPIRDKKNKLETGRDKKNELGTVQDDELGRVRDDFFEKMVNLLVLDLSSTNITSLPSSIKELTHLRGLYLNACLVLAELPEELKTLKHLETLQIENTEIEVLWPPKKIKQKSTDLTYLIESSVMSGVIFPLKKERESTDQKEEDPPVTELESADQKEIDPPVMEWKSTKLTCLIVSSVMSGVIFPLKWISKLSSLEHLVILVPKNNQWWTDNINAIVEEVASLRNLRKLHFHFPKVEHLQRFLSESQSWIEESLFSFQFFVGSYKSSQREKEWYGSLIYAAIDDIMIPDAITHVLSRSQKFELEENNVIKRLSEFGMENMKGLKRCAIRRCHAVEVLANGKEKEDDVLPNLEELELDLLSKLRNIVEESLSPKSFANIRRLVLRRCRSLNHIFPWSMVKQLSKLETLNIFDCNQLEDIFEQNEIEKVRNDDCQLSNFKYLILKDLPNLDGIDKILTLALSSIEKIVIVSCGIKSLPSSLVNAPMLRKIEGYTKWWNEELKWEDETVKQDLQPLFQLYR